MSAIDEGHFGASMTLPMRHKKGSYVLENTRGGSCKNTKSAYEIVLVSYLITLRNTINSAGEQNCFRT